MFQVCYMFESYSVAACTRQVNIWKIKQMFRCDNSCMYSSCRVQHLIDMSRQTDRQRGPVTPCPYMDLSRTSARVDYLQALTDRASVQLQHSADYQQIIITSNVFVSIDQTVTFHSNSCNTSLFGS